MKSLFISVVAFGLTASLACFGSDQTSTEGFDFVRNDYVLSPDLVSKTFAKDVKPACVKFWSGLTSITNAEMAKRAFAGQIQIPSDCAQASAAISSTRVVDQLRKGCDPKADTKTLGNGCVFYLFVFRAALIDQMTRPAPGTPEDYGKMNPWLLANKFFGRLITQDGAPTISSTHFDDLTEMLNVLQSRNPQSLSIAKATLAVEFMKLRATHEKGTQIDEKPMQTALAKAEKLAPKDESLRELGWLMLLEKNEQAMVEKDVRSYLKTKPDSITGQYYLAGIYWYKQDRDQTVAILERVKKAHPDDKRVNDTLTRVRSAKFGENVFTSNINFKFF